MGKEIDLSEFELIKLEHAILKDRREQVGLTQQQVADIAGINIRQYQRFESGERRISSTSFRIGVAVADVLGLDVHELIATPSVAAYLKEKQEFERLKKQDGKKQDGEK